jgi:hypothetical protein
MNTASIVAAAYHDQKPRHDERNGNLRGNRGTKNSFFLFRASTLTATHSQVSHRYEANTNDQTTLHFLGARSSQTNASVRRTTISR